MSLLGELFGEALAEKIQERKGRIVLILVVLLILGLLILVGRP